MDDLQPPSGGCVLKLLFGIAFIPPVEQPPSGGCVLKRTLILVTARITQAAAFGRLCVETLSAKRLGGRGVRSRLRAAVC